MPCMKASGDIPLGVLRGDVTPPATRFWELAECSAAYPGLSSRFTYLEGETGEAKTPLFGSFQIVHIRTHGKRTAAAETKSPKPLVGRCEGALPPLAHD